MIITTTDNNSKNPFIHFLLSNAIILVYSVHLRTDRVVLLTVKIMEAFKELLLLLAIGLMKKYLF